MVVVEKEGDGGCLIKTETVVGDSEDGGGSYGRERWLL